MHSQKQHVVVGVKNKHLLYKLACIDQILPHESWSLQTQQAVVAQAQVFMVKRQMMWGQKPKAEESCLRWLINRASTVGQGSRVDVVGAMKSDARSSAGE